MPEVITFKIEDFEGPLDLLLFLVGKNKMNLYDINIMELIDQYTATIRNLQDNRMEVASEFIDMAAHLVQMKSALLLPRSPEAERMKAELTGRLMEYSACKEVAAKLGSRARDLYTAVRQPMPLVGAAEYTRRHDPNLLVTAWFNLMGRNLRKRKPTQERFEPLVTAPFVSGQPQHPCSHLSGAAGAYPRRAHQGRRRGPAEPGPHPPQKQGGFRP